jgi:hypothetical protein
MMNHLQKYFRHRTDEDERSALFPLRSPPGTEAVVSTRSEAGCDSRVHLDPVENRDISGQCRKSNPGSSAGQTIPQYYAGVLISLWLFLFAAQPKEFFLDVLKKLEQRSHKCVWSSGGNM